MVSGVVKITASYCHATSVEEVQDRCYVLSQEEDFLEQEERLAEVIQRAGFNIIFYPKHHCELNYIEDGPKVIIDVLVRTIIKV